MTSIGGGVRKRKKRLEKKCKEVENMRLSAKEMFQKIKEITGKRSAPSSKCIKASDGSVLHDAKDIANRWEEYIKDLFDDDQDHEEIFLEGDTGPPILRSEVRWALGKMKNGRSSGPDGICIEMVRALGDAGVDLMWRLISQVYETGVFPKEMLRSIFVMIPKIPRTLDCSNHRTISLMSHILKLLLRIVLQRIRQKILPEIPQNQFGFMKDRGASNAIFVLRVLGERAIEHQ